MTVINLVIEQAQTLGYSQALLEFEEWLSQERGN